MGFTPEETAAVGKIPSGLFIVAARYEGKIDGFLASFIQQVSMDPLLLTLAVKPGRPAYEAISSGDIFTVNIAGDHDRSYMKEFWKGYDPKDNPFERIDWQETPEGGIQLKGALTAIDCRKMESHQPGDHELVIAEVVHCYPVQPDSKPMTHTRKNGLSY